MKQPFSISKYTPFVIGIILAALIGGDQFNCPPAMCGTPASAKTQPRAFHDGEKIEYCQLSFPPGRPLAEILWKSGSAPNRKRLVNGKERALAAGRLAVPRNSAIELILLYDGLEHLDALDQFGQCLITNFSASKLEFDDAAMTHIKVFKHLDSLNLNETLVTDKSLPVIGCLVDLNALRLSSTDVTGEGFDALLNLKHLFNLNLYGTPLKKGSLAKLKPLFPQLYDLDLTGVNMQKSDAELLQYLSTIVNLDLHANGELDDSCVKYLSKLNTLQVLYITDTKITDKSLPVLAKLPKLKTLVVRPAKFWTPGQPHAKLRPGLEIVDAVSRSRAPLEIFRPVH